MKRLIIAVLLMANFGAIAGEVTCRTDVWGDKVCSDGTRTHTTVNGDEVTK